MSVPAQAAAATLHAQGATDAKAPLQVFEELIRVVWNERRVERLHDLLAPGFVMHTTSGRDVDAAGYEEAVRSYHAAFPDLRVEVLRTLVDGPLLAAQVVLAGTMVEPFAGHAATGRAMRVEGHPWVRVENGRIAEFWSFQDDVHLWAQLGLPPHTL